MNVAQIERKTQDRVIKLFTDKEKLDYDYLGNWEERTNSNIEEELLIKFLKKQKRDSYRHKLPNKKLL